MIKCISFDLWGTLITGNPAYKLARLRIMSDYVDHSRFSPDAVQRVFDSVKRDFDTVTETYGVQFNSGDLYSHIFDALNITNSYIRQQIRSELHCEFVRNPPLIIDGTLEALDELARNHLIILISNTLLVDGPILYEGLRPSGLWINFDNLTFSSDVRHAKPSWSIFNSAFASVGVSADQVVHVGDNVRTDGYGIERVGGTFFHINGTSGKTIKDVEAQYGN